jgi:hypothetical protein
LQSQFGEIHLVPYLNSALLTVSSRGASCG